MPNITVAISGNVEIAITCAKCHEPLKVTHQANDFNKNWIEIKPHLCKES